MFTESQIARADYEIQWETFKICAKKIIIDSSLINRFLGKLFTFPQWMEISFENIY